MQDRLSIQIDQTFEVRSQQSKLQLVARVARQAQGTTTRNTLNVFRSAALLEVHDSYFHHNSAVMMPDSDAEQGPDEPFPVFTEDSEYMRHMEKSNPEHHDRFRKGALAPAPSDEDADRVPGLGLLVAAYRFQELNPEFRLLLAGHTDTTGDDTYNFGLSDLRARNVLHLLLGERRKWVDVSQARSTVEDHQRILKHYARRFGWDCDPGQINNVAGPNTEQALLRFQQTYNRLLGHSIAEDGRMGVETWGAFFDLYMEELASMLGTTVDNLPARRTVRFDERMGRHIACGEKKPIDEPSRDNFRSKENRRVEFLFFREPLLPDVSCHGATKPFCMKNTALAACGVYGPDRFDFVHIRASELAGSAAGPGSDSKFRMGPTSEDLSQLRDRPDEKYAGTLAGSPLDLESPWGFLDPFAQHDPGDAPHEIHRGEESGIKGQTS